MALLLSLGLLATAAGILFVAPAMISHPELRTWRWGLVLAGLYAMFGLLSWSWNSLLR